jgi:hypothetical protein
MWQDEPNPASCAAWTAIGNEVGWHEGELGHGPAFRIRDPDARPDGAGRLLGREPARAGAPPAFERVSPGGCEL